MLEIMDETKTNDVMELFAACNQKAGDFLKERYLNYVSYAINEEALSNITCTKALVHVKDYDLKANVIVNAVSKDSLDLADSFKKVFDISAHQELLTIAPSSFEAYFDEYEKISKTAIYRFERHSFPYKLEGDIRHDIDKAELLKLYLGFGRHFKTFLKRDSANYSELKNVSGLYQNERLSAYMIYQIKLDEVVIDELIYEDLRSLLTLVSYALTLKSNVELHLSDGENIARFLKTSPSLSDDLIIKINDLELYKRLFKIEAKDMHEALAKTFCSPLYLKGYLL